LAIASGLSPCVFFLFSPFSFIRSCSGFCCSGSKSLEDTIDWMVDGMKKDGLEKVCKESVKVIDLVDFLRSFLYVHLPSRTIGSSLDSWARIVYND
jgi:hypothetical protein